VQNFEIAMELDTTQHNLIAPDLINFRADRGRP